MKEKEKVKKQEERGERQTQGVKVCQKLIYTKNISLISMFSDTYVPIKTINVIYDGEYYSVEDGFMKNTPWKSIEQLKDTKDVSYFYLLPSTYYFCEPIFVLVELYKIFKLQ